MVPGDVVKAKVKSLSESKNILLSVEDRNLGVVVSYSEDGDILVAVN